MKRADLWAWGLLILAVLPLSFLAMAPALDGDFVNWDDDIYVYGNPMIADLSPRGLGTMFTTLHAGHYFPLVLLSYGIDYRCDGLNPAVFHRTNLLLHLAGVVSVFVFVRLLTSSPPAALLCALLFGIHPAHAESVTWIAERKDVLYTPLFYLALSAWLLWIRQSARRWYLASLALFAAALASKAMAITLPLVLLLIDRQRGKPMNRSALLEKLPFFLLSAASAVVTLAARDRYYEQLREHPYRLADLPVSLYRLVFVHLGEILVPAGIFPLHPHRASHLPAGAAPGLVVGFATVLCVVLLGVLLSAFRRRSHWAFGPLFFLVTMLPVIRITAPGYFADRYTYATSVGIFLLAAAAIGRLWNARRGRRPLRIALLLLLTAVVVAMPMESRSRSRMWGDSFTLWSRAIQLYPEVGDAYFERAGLFAERGDHRSAIADFRSAERFGFCWAELYDGRAASFLALGEEDAALRDLDIVLSMKPDQVAALRRRAILRMRRGDVDGAIRDGIAAQTAERSGN